MTDKEKMLAGLPYNPGDPELVELRLRARLATEKFNRTSIVDMEERTALLKALFGSTGESINVEPSFNCDYGENIHVGENFYANFGCVILDVAPVVIGDNCFIAPQVGIYTATHPIDPAQRCSGLEYAESVRIGNNCWIGGHATINPGVELGNNVVVASGSVVTRSFGDNVVIGGNPAKVIKSVPLSDEVT
ncbi:sugar O-acetyltransferase [Marinobacterium rhizophilum]|uniref:sugar O-acetyltransferase n=1 Tax=Marinobacterium rhizophilum TaxID=420402 RepID=UPI00036DA8D7|nr:sugar O-acetyltransferase [Marinobacterium rhizophilum]